MNNSSIFVEAEQRMMRGEEPTAMDWFVFRGLYKKKPFFLKRKRRLYKHLERHLYDHDYTEFNEEERHTFRLMLSLEESSRNRLYGVVSLSILILFAAFVKSFF